MIRAVLLDFDGVILESVDVKTDAFRSLFSRYPDHVDRIVRFHLDNGGMSRFDKFDYIFSNILHQPLTAQDREELSETFSSLVYERILTTPFVAGAREFIERMSLKIPLYIISATPEKELAAIAEHRGLTRYFHRIYGSPKKKADCIREIISQTRIPPGEILFVGDALNDMDAARKAGVRFIGRVREGDPDLFSRSPYPEATVHDLSELMSYVEGIA